MTAAASSKSQLQDARKKLARQQKLDGLLAKHKDLLKKDILKKRALLEKELQLQIHVRLINVIYPPSILESFEWCAELAFVSVIAERTSVSEAADPES